MTKWLDIARSDLGLQAIPDEMKAVEERSRTNREDVKEIQQKVLPRVPAWQVEVKRGGS